MTFVGANPEELRKLSGQLKVAGEKIEEARKTLASCAKHVHWPGPDGDDFRNDMSGRFSLTLHRATEALLGASVKVAQQAEEQERTSTGGQAPMKGEQNAFWPWEDGHAPWFGGDADLQDDIPLGVEVFTLDNVNQEDYPNCQTVAVLGALAAHDPEYFQRHIRRIGDEHYEVTLYVNGEPVVYTVQGEVGRGGVRGEDGNQTWLTIYEAALMESGILTQRGRYSQFGYMGVFTQVTGASGERFNFGDPDWPSYEELTEMIEDGPVVVGTVNRPIGDARAEHLGVEPLQIVERHMYMVESVNADGTITIVNPWGADAAYPDDAGTHRLTVTQDQFELYFDEVQIPAPRSEWR